VDKAGHFDCELGELFACSEKDTKDVVNESSIEEEAVSEMKVESVHIDVGTFNCAVCAHCDSVGLVKYFLVIGEIVVLANEFQDAA
jgi:hypothetical protein